MGLKGKLSASIEINCGGHLMYDYLYTKPHLIPNITPSKILSFEFIEGEIIKVGSVIRWKYNDGNIHFTSLFIWIDFFLCV